MAQEPNETRLSGREHVLRLDLHDTALRFVQRLFGCWQ
jgi:hypothetical protein